MFEAYRWAVQELHALVHDAAPYRLCQQEPCVTLNRGGPLPHTHPSQAAMDAAEKRGTIGSTR